jgi:hypothetical protein
MDQIGLRIGMDRGEKVFIEIVWKKLLGNLETRAKIVCSS